MSDLGQLGLQALYPRLDRPLGGAVARPALQPLLQPRDLGDHGRGVPRVDRRAQHHVAAAPVVVCPNIDSCSDEPFKFHKLESLKSLFSSPFLAASVKVSNGTHTFHSRMIVVGSFTQQYRVTLVICDKLLLTLI